MAPLAEILRLNGYSTAQFGKCHEVPVWEASPVGPFDRWPTGSGFEYFTDLSPERPTSGIRRFTKERRVSSLRAHPKKATISWPI
jgi:arylsulfatase A-like enzyme